MIPNRLYAYPPPPVRDFDTEEANLRAEIEGHERLAKSIWKILPAFVTESAIQRMGLDNIAEVLSEFHTELRAYFCEGFEAELANLIEERAKPQPRWKPPKPTIEEIASAQMNVNRLEEAISAMDNLGEKENYAFGAYVAMMRPILEGNVQQAREYLSHLQERMEASDEAAETSVSNGTEPGEEQKPHEAKPSS